MKNGDMPAMPAYHEGMAVTLGLTKRELFAAMAMRGMLSSNDPHVMRAPAEHHAMWAVSAADALLAALDASRPVEPKPQATGGGLGETL